MIIDFTDESEQELLISYLRSSYLNYVQTLLNDFDDLVPEGPAYITHLRDAVNYLNEYLTIEFKD